MMVIELTEDKFGKAMKDIACIEDKLNGIKELFEHESMGQRRYNEYPEYDDMYRSREYRPSRGSGRYM